jgi:hypothetical protein
MNPVLQAVTVAKQQVCDIEARYPAYHTDLVNTLVQVIQTQAAGLSDQRRRTEVGQLIDAFGSAVAAKQGR